MEQLSGTPPMRKFKFQNWKIPIFSFKRLSDCLILGKTESLGPASPFSVEMSFSTLLGYLLKKCLHRRINVQTCVIDFFQKSMEILVIEKKEC